MRNRIFLLLILSACFSVTPGAFAQTSEPAKEASHSSAVTQSKNEKAVKKEDTKTSADAKSSAATKTASDNKAAKILPSDVRVLIDVSGSMKQTDPKNLRKPALDLIVRLLPDKSRAGVWTFGNSVNMLMPFKPVDAAWRKQAAAKSNEINSIAMYTNIGKGLDEVSFDKNSLSPDYKTHIVLLTDGVVDIGKDAVGNNTERQRIINDILPSLKSAGYVVHTIALSENSDMDLLKKISIATDGVYTLAVSADQLMSVFLKIFDQAVPAERVPLENNGFLVDASIKEFTALIFRKPGEDRTVIESPEGKEYSATNPGDGINWYRTDKYDLITADLPKAGQWKIKTEIAPQSRITVVSNLQLIVDPLKNNIHSNDALPVSYSFQENEKTITDKEFLGLIEANAIVAKDNTEENTSASFTASVPPADGFFHQSLNTFPSTGDYELHIYVDGKTFKREFKHSLTVRDSLLVLEKTKADDEHGKTTYTYKISTDEKIVDIKKTQVSVSIKNSQNNNLDKNLSLLDSNRWEFSFSPIQEGEYNIDIRAQGDLLDGGKLDETLHADTFTHTIKKAEQASSVAKEEPKAVEEKPEESNNMLLYAAIGLGNLLLIVAIYFAYRFFMGGKAKDELAEFEKTLAATSATDVKSSGKASEEKTVTKKPPEKTEIDLSDEDPAHIPMSDDDSSLDKLFPLDSMDDPTDKK
ncbi:hypothetical protein GCM10011613_06790 [Cellvibrio zantedeschiae]|uniref:VWFA domain-containing protein n=1 Tax=Cellvibrio zantedeschiae TaxID=1237077 RepID=A0ABQ3ASM4_9GAMM|nr:vWA domain-containing protein [Cellvibrio zantedeschiae]GGY65563.1 hypothetical protein GCM10011613_06790 [Cellvibrio zantedeschiae]